MKDGRQPGGDRAQGFWSRLRRVFSASGPAPGREPDLRVLEDILGYRFSDLALLENALLHRSQVHVSGRQRRESNERLEFLGDAILGAVVSDHLYHSFPGHSEGDLTKMKSLLVCGARLAEVAMEHDLGRYVRMSRSEAAAGGRTRPTILADATEAVIGAVYLDGGFGAAAGVIHRIILAGSSQVLDRRSLRNYKSRLQEIIQARHKSPPRYKVVSAAGPDHERRFEVAVTFEGRVLGRGQGSSKKAAEQMAARAALAELEELEDGS